MTTEEVAKLAEHLFHSCVANRLWVPAPGKKQKFTDAVLPILTAHLAAREEEYERLREAAAERISQIMYPELPGRVDSDGVMFARENVRDNVEGVLTALFAPYVAALTAARSSVKKELELLAHLDGPERVEELQERLNAIDAMTKGVGDGT